MVNKRRVIGVTAGVLALAIAVVAAAFKREYVMSSGGLVDLQARSENGRVVIVSGSLLPSGARITKTTLERQDGRALVRVYVAGIEPTDRPEDCRGAFAVAIPIADDVTTIAVGDSSRSVTIGEVFGMPVRIPRWPTDATVNRVLWTSAR